jgi:hypothetical protein
MRLKFWDLGRDQDPWGTRRPRMHSTLDQPDLFALLPRRYQWIGNVLLIVAVLLVMYFAR